VGAAARDEPDWPEPARPGGAGATAGATADPPPGRGARPDPVAQPEVVDEMDEVDVVGDARTTPGTGEQQALDVLGRSFATVEKIGEVAP
jgi:hypothetical protein